MESEMLSVTQVIKRLGLKRSFAYKLIANEPGVIRFTIPGSKKPVIRVPVSVLDRIIRRSAIPASR
jgi:predicted DNA-binding transcriptional regulator AlpA